MELSGQVSLISIIKLVGGKYERNPLQEGKVIFLKNRIFGMIG
jgi:hypothetical protein